MAKTAPQTAPERKTAIAAWLRELTAVSEAPRNDNGLIERGLRFTGTVDQMALTYAVLQEVRAIRQILTAQVQGGSPHAPSLRLARRRPGA